MDPDSGMDTVGAAATSAEPIALLDEHNRRLIANVVIFRTVQQLWAFWSR